MSRRVVSLVIVLVAIACCTGLVLAAKPGGGGGCPQPRPNCVCPAIYDPVICDGGCSYSNSCRANCAGARNCVSSGGGPVELTAEQGEDCSANATPALESNGTASFADFLAAEATASGKGPCKSCRERPWCSCKYNGLPRVSCDPCCYGNLGIPQVCLD
jgi:hypothetical protein